MDLQKEIEKASRQWLGQSTGGKTNRPIDKNVKMNVWRKYFGTKGEGKCYVCKRTIYIDHFQVGHNKARVKGGSDNINNLRPICGPCNRSMRTMSIETYKKKYFKKPTKTKTPKKRKNKRKKKPKGPLDVDSDWLKY
jgi:5-methylcytosine-specific restriction endonuclease McrA